MANWQKRNKFKQQEKQRKEGQASGAAGSNPFRSQVPLHEQLAWQEERDARDEVLDRQFGYALVTPGPPRLGFLLKMGPTSSVDRETGQSRAALGLYFLQADGTCFKCVKVYEPYFYLLVKEKYLGEVEEFLRRTFGKEVAQVAAVDKEDLELTNHLSGLKRRYLRVSFQTIPALLGVRGKLMGKIKKNRRRLGIEETYSEMHQNDAFDKADNDEHDTSRDYADFIYDIREYDVTYYQRVAIDLGFRVGYWYEVKYEGGVVKMDCRPELLDRPRLKVMAFDIETTHAPMRFPDAESDQITMISYMLDQQGFLVVNRELVSEDVRDFEYTPKPEFFGPFRIFNEANEAAMLRRFFSHCRSERPHVYVSFNGDTFDWPFIEKRAKAHGIGLHEEIGMYGDRNDEYTCHYASHLDCYKWVVRDSYLPAGSQGLKAVTKAKLGYDPLELDPEEMVRFASEQPQTLASYSVSDAVATYYLYQNYVHPFIFSLCTIIPMHPDDVLRKGSGTLCEALLMVQATRANVIYPNKSAQEVTKMHNGHLIETETYIGGHVESLAAGLFRSDIPMEFKLDVPTLESLLGQLDDTMRFAITTDGKAKSLDEVANYDAVRNEIAAMLTRLRDDPQRQDNPRIYHLDVGAMYPNIILTNRLQPSAIVDELTCAGCDFNKPQNRCQRKQNWTWRGDLFPSSMPEYEQMRTQLESEKFPDPRNKDKTVTFFQLPLATQQLKLKQRLKDYCRRVYKKNHVTVVEERSDTVCMRENSFYVDTVRLFRDRRYEYKADWTTWKNKLAKAESDKDPQAVIKAKEMVVIYESLQIAHKCILNSFYGYVMRRGARWFSMKMAGMVTKTGAQIIQRTRELVERVGIPLELDTDGIWCVLPASFPEDFRITWKDPARKPFVLSYTCQVLNHMVNREFTNDQYQTLMDPARKTYSIQSENSIFFEVDGPYRAMVLPASSEEGKTLKKRYAVFRMDGSLAELK
jgi:DNA polymerase epsilon subunit 1